MRKLALLALLALPLAAAKPSDPLALVPPDATAVGMIRVSDIRTSPYAPRLLREADHATIDGDGARFLAEAHLRPTEDVDTVVFAATGGGEGSHGSGLAIIEGRFEAPAVESALLSRGAVKKEVAGGSLLVLPEGEHHEHAEHGGPGALAFLDRHLAVAGPLPAVEAALAQAAARTDFRAGNGLARHLGRIPHDATAWVLVDLARTPKGRHGEAQVHGDGQVAQFAAAMRQVPLLAVSATLKSDALKLGAFGLCQDEETRGLIEDSVRGVLAAWRLSVQDEHPELVSVLRGFKVEQSKDGVSLSGTVKGSALQALLDRKDDAHR